MHNMASDYTGWSKSEATAESSTNCINTRKLKHDFLQG